MFYCMFYFTCDRSFSAQRILASDLFYGAIQKNMNHQGPRYYFHLVKTVKVDLAHTYSVRAYFSGELHFACAQVWLQAFIISQLLAGFWKNDSW